MRKSWKQRGAIVCGLVTAVVLMNLGENTAHARSKYLKQFLAEYKNIEKEAKKTKCNVCHFGKSKKKYNDYGKAMKTIFGKKKNVKVAAEIKEVLKKTAKEKSSVKDKTFGDLIKDGKLPGTAPKKK